LKINGCNFLLQEPFYNYLLFVAQIIDNCVQLFNINNPPETFDLKITDDIQNSITLCFTAAINTINAESFPLQKILRFNVQQLYDIFQDCISKYKLYFYDCNPNVEQTENIYESLKDSCQRHLEMYSENHIFIQNLIDEITNLKELYQPKPFPCSFQTPPFSDEAEAEIENFKKQTEAAEKIPPVFPFPQHSKKTLPIVRDLCSQMFPLWEDALYFRKKYFYYNQTGTMFRFREDLTRCTHLMDHVNKKIDTIIPGVENELFNFLCGKSQRTQDSLENMVNRGHFFYSATIYEIERYLETTPAYSGAYIAFVKSFLHFLKPHIPGSALHSVLPVAPRAREEHRQTERHLSTLIELGFKPKLIFFFPVVEHLKKISFS
jgi:hypothetical protein